MKQADKTEQQGSLKSLSLSFFRRTLTLSIISTYQGWVPVTLMLVQLVRYFRKLAILSKHAK